MRDPQTGQTKTEQPTPKKLRDLRKRGDVARSPDVPATAVMLAGITFLALGGAYTIDHLNNILNRAASADFTMFDDTTAVLRWTRELMYEGVMLSLPMVLTLSLASALAGVIQVGGVFSAHPIKPQISRVNPIEGAKRLFSLRTLIELLKLIVKTVLLGALLWVLIVHAMPDLLRSHWLTGGAILPFAIRLFEVLAWSTAAMFIAIAAFDLWFQNWDYRRRNRMSIEEVRREHKEAEGDPHVRARRRQLHREIGDATMLENVRKASVVVVNPTHIAVALYYAAGETDLPVVVAKGEGHLAREIRRIAQEEGIPVLHNVDLARRLQAAAPIDQYIPDEFIEPVAAVLRWARNLNRNTP